MTDMRNAINVASRVNARWFTIDVGDYERSVETAYQTATATDNLKRAAGPCEPTGPTFVLEPLN
tara:strand:+ start:374 stop:565 length:192 start_codon:yes stop_codon:yes gene_type:complete